MMTRAWATGNSLDHADPGALKLLDLVGIIRKQPKLSYAESLQRRRREIVIARIVREPELAIRFDRVEPLVLQLVRLHFIDEADAAALLRQIQDNSAGSLGNGAQRKFELSAAIASLGGEHVAGQALRVNAHHGRGVVLHFAVLDGD